MIFTADTDCQPLTRVFRGGWQFRLKLDGVLRRYSHHDMPRPEFVSLRHDRVAHANFRDATHR
ncbi:hypothetical protein I553_0589 [Mycobacterium xenopi 4042]|uniref:Uncharacterized protein n=1 Tax=Mycobacterium xenopi 4042 TaxID=1299334 RepID=X7YIF1_MYCXE|nr:hypothetical protein I553_0589 [Mycobacterium xenopi 4042]